MPKQRNPKRDQALKLYIEMRGKITPKEIAKKLGAKSSEVRRWKYKDKWESQLPKRGAPKGNKNAAGNNGGAPKGNTNAETHGAYSVPRVENWDQNERERILGVKLEFDPLADRQLKLLLAKQHDLERRIAALVEVQDKDKDNEVLYLDRSMTVKLPNGGEMQYRSKSTAFSRQMTLEAELNKVQGRIQKLLDSIRAREDAAERAKLDRQRFEFAKQKTLGEFILDDTGHIAPDGRSEVEVIVE